MFNVSNKNTSTASMRSFWCFNGLMAHRNSWTLDAKVGRWTLDAGLWTLDSGRWTLNAELWSQTLDAGLWTLDAEPWTLNSRRWTPDIQRQTEDVKTLKFEMSKAFETVDPYE